MKQIDWREFLLPDEEEREPRFRAQIDRLSVFGLRIIAAVCFSGVAFFALAAAVVPEGVGLPPGGWYLPLTIFMLGALAVGVSTIREARPYARWAGCLVGYGVALAQFLTLASYVDRPEIAFFLFSGIVTGVMLIGLAALPLRPVHSFTLGATIAVTYASVLPLVAPQLSGGRGASLIYVIQILVLCTALTVIVYRQRVLAFRARRAARDALDQLRSAQARLIVAESAHSQTRFAAALSHELNTPLGALTSAFDTLIHLVRKTDIATDARYQEILVGAEAAGRGSSARLSEIVDRMAFLTNLDKAEQQSVDLNELCRETAASIRGEWQGKVELVWDLETLPSMTGRPQQLGAVINNLLRNAVAATADGSEGGRVTITSRERLDSLVVEVRDTGRGIEPERLRTLFEPTLQVDGDRVAATNWSLFVCRTIVTEHDGQLHIESEPGKGTTARISLPST